MSEVRRALIEEIGRFQEFEPLLISLESKPEYEPEEPTLTIIQERGRYLSRLVAQYEQRGDIERRKRLAEIYASYTEAVSAIESKSEQIKRLEQNIFHELADSLAM